MKAVISRIDRRRAVPTRDEPSAVALSSVKPRCVDLVGVEMPTAARGAGGQRLVAERRLEEADRRADARTRRDQATVDAELLAQPRGMQRRRAAEGDHDVVGDVLAVLDGMNAGGIGHVLVDDLADAESGGGVSSAEALRRHRAAMAAFGRLAVESLMAPPAKLSGSSLPSTRSASVIVGAVAAALVAGGAGLRAGALGPGLDLPQRIDPGDRAAAGADLDHLDDRDRDRHAASPC